MWKQSIRCINPGRNIIDCIAKVWIQPCLHRFELNCHIFSRYLTEFTISYIVYCFVPPWHLVSYGMRCCERSWDSMNDARLKITCMYTQQYKMAEENHMEYEFCDKNEDMNWHQYIDASETYFSIIKLKKKFCFADIPTFCRILSRSNPQIYKVFIVSPSLSVKILLNDLDGSRSSIVRFLPALSHLIYP